MTDSCCKPNVYPDSSLWTDGTVDTTSGSKAPRVKSDLNIADHFGWWRVRWNIGRGTFTVKPGLYAVGDPDSKSHVIVTANYKMSFDYVRRALKDRNAWILVLDTKGINVWCAAGKGTFGTDELITEITNANLGEVVDTKRVIIPQLGASGVCARTVTKETGFRVLFGPVRASDIPAYLDNDLKATPEMRRVTFTLQDRVILIPVELIMAGKYIVISAIALLLTSVLLSKTLGLDTAGIGARSITALLSAWLAGSIFGPTLLPLLPGRAFAVKGAAAGLLAVGALCFMLGANASAFEVIAWILTVPAVASFITMNFTGTSTYTSPSGVKKEMTYAVPGQAIACLLGIAALITAFVRLA